MRDQQEFDNFEKYLQDEADKEVLFPSDSVWSNIAKQVQPKTKWKALPIISMIVFISLTAATYFNYPPKNILSSLFKYQPQQFPLQQHPIPTTPIAKIFTLQDSKTKKHSVSINIPNSLVNIGDRMNSDNYSDNTNDKSLTDIITQNNLLDGTYPLNIEGVATIRANKSNQSFNANYGSEHLNQISTKSANGTATEIINSEALKLNIKNAQKHLETKSLTNLMQPIVAPPAFDDELPPLVRTLRPKPQMINPWSYEFYGTPSISFRKLEDDMVRNQLYNNSSTNNGLIQKAGIGSEIGAAVHYKLSNNLSLTTGLQFNIRQYYIRALNSTGLATVKIVQNNRLDSINFTSAYSNSEGNNNTRLNNKLYQIALPLGINWHIFQLNKVGIDLNASIQPTFSLNKNVYIISTDYKYYANGDAFFRQWNINSSLGLCFNYRLNKSSIYFGPQIRYQHLSTYNDRYPIKEYRLDYGLRMGIVTPIK